VAVVGFLGICLCRPFTAGLQPGALIAPPRAGSRLVVICIRDCRRPSRPVSSVLLRVLEPVFAAADGVVLDHAELPELALLTVVASSAFRQAMITCCLRRRHVLLRSTFPIVYSAALGYCYSANCEARGASPHGADRGEFALPRAHEKEAELAEGADRVFRADASTSVVFLNLKRRCPSRIISS